MKGVTRTHFVFAIALALLIGIGAMMLKEQQGGQAVVAAPDTLAVPVDRLGNNDYTIP